MLTNEDVLTNTTSSMGKNQLVYDNNYIGNNSLSLKHLFLVGGFAESPILQEAIRKEFGRIMHVVIPQVKYRNLTFFSKSSYNFHWLQFSVNHIHSFKGS